MSWKILTRPWRHNNPEKTCVEVRCSQTGRTLTLCITDVAANDVLGGDDTPENAEKQLIRHLQRLADLACEKKSADPGWDTIVSSDLR